MQLVENAGACGASLRRTEYWIRAGVLQQEHQNHLKHLKQIPPLIYQVPDWIDRFGVGTENLPGNFAASSYVIMMLLLLGLHLENYWIMATRLITDSHFLVEIESSW